MLIEEQKTKHFLHFFLHKINIDDYKLDHIWKVNLKEKMYMINKEMGTMLSVEEFEVRSEKDIEEKC